MSIKTRNITTAFLLVSVTAMAAGNAWAAGRAGHDSLRSTLSATAAKQLVRAASNPKGEVQKAKTIKAKVATPAARNTPALKAVTTTGPDPWPQNPTYESNIIGTGIPQFYQVGGFSAFVPMVHASCGADCLQHVLANQNGNKEVEAKISLNCPAGQLVDSLYYVVNGNVSMQFIDSPTENDVSFDVIVEPWTANDFQATGQVALGGNWDSGPGDSASSQTAIAQMTDMITMIGTCTNSATVVQEYQAQTQAGFKDLDYNG